MKILSQRSARVTIGALLLVVCAVSLSAQAKDPLVGTWKQNVAKGSCIVTATNAPCGNPPPQVATTRVFEDLGNGFMYVMNDGMNAQGMPNGNRIVFKRDGRDYPIAARGQTGVVTIAFTVKSTSPFAADYVTKTDGKVTTTATETVSPDGKTYTATTKATDAQGRPIVTVLVLEKQ